MPDVSFSDTDVKKVLQVGNMLEQFVFTNHVRIADHFHLLNTIVSIFHSINYLLQSESINQLNIGYDRKWLIHSML